ncbi:MAG: NAD(P)H-binding protein [Proteobacteria bacterium]|nr:NAD(P)H-binding protein [Pseudomonadota bacterium]
MRIAVTAASGRLGHALLRELPQQAAVTDVVAIARDPARVRTTGIEKRAGDYRSADDMRDALRGIDTVVLISAPVAGGAERIALHRNVIQAARDAGVNRVLFTSVIGNGLEMNTLFAPTQQVNRQTEKDLQASGLQWVIGRNGLYLELDVIQMRNAAQSGVYSNPAGDGLCPYISIDEIASAYASMAIDARHAGHTYNITSENLSQSQLLRQVCEVFKMNVRYQPMSDDACIEKFKTLMPQRGDAVARMLTGCFQSIRAGAFDVPSNYLDAAGRPAKSVKRMLGMIAAKCGGFTDD